MLGFYAEKAGAMLYAHRCAKVAVHIADFPYCTEVVPVIMDKSTKTKFTNPIIEVVYPDFTLTSCDQLLLICIKLLKAFRCTMKLTIAFLGIRNFCSLGFCCQSAFHAHGGIAFE